MHSASLLDLILNLESICNFLAVICLFVWLEIHTVILSPNNLNPLSIQLPLKVTRFVYSALSQRFIDLYHPPSQPPWGHLLNLSPSTSLWGRTIFPFVSRMAAKEITLNSHMEASMWDYPLLRNLEISGKCVFSGKSHFSGHLTFLVADLSKAK